MAACSGVADRRRAPRRAVALVRCLLGLLISVTAACTPQSAAPQEISAEPTTPLRPSVAAGTTPQPDVATATGAPDDRGHVGPEPTGAPTSAATTVAQFPVDMVGEASGLAVSRRNPGVAWVLDDGPGTSGVVAVPYGPPGPAATGAAATQAPATGGAVTVGAVTLEGLDGRDTEALAVGDCAADDPRSCLYIGDIGDNRRSRDSIRIHRVVEPDLSGGLPDAPLAADTVTLTYPDGPTDAEAMFAVDGRLFIVSKAPFAADTAATGTTRLYELPRFSDGELQPRGEVPVPRPSVALAADVVGNVVTGADATGDAVVLRTYDHAVRYTAPASGADPATFGTWPFAEIPTTGPLQTEAIAFDVGDCATLTAGEGSGRIWRIPCTQRAAPSGRG